MNSLPFLRRGTCYLNISLVFVLVILTFTSCLQLHMTFFLVFYSNPSLETRGLFLDASKAFDGAWHDGLLSKLKQNVVSENLFGLIKSFHSDRVPRVTLNGKISDWKCILAGVPQGSILGPLFFLVYINNLANDLKLNVTLFTDDISLFYSSF